MESTEEALVSGCGNTVLYRDPYWRTETYTGRTVGYRERQCSAQRKTKKNPFTGSTD